LTPVVAFVSDVAGFVSIGKSTKDMGDGDGVIADEDIEVSIGRHLPSWSSAATRWRP
jgi:hypothetical protein